MNILTLNYLDTWPQHHHCVHSCSDWGGHSPVKRTHYQYSEHCPTEWDHILDQNTQWRMQLLLQNEQKYMKLKATYDINMFKRNVSYTICGVSQLPADHLCIQWSPEIITHSAPYATRADLDSPFMAMHTTHQPQIAFSRTSNYRKNIKSIILLCNINNSNFIERG